MNLAKAIRRLASRKICLRHHRQYAKDVKPIDHTSTEKPRVIFSGIQPTGVPHLGNYLGALRPWVELQNESKKQDRNNFCVVDLHALTVKQDAETLLRWRKESFASLLAVGLDPKKSVVFYQADVPHHSELMWLLSTVASTGYLSRMTQWKSKLNLAESVSMDDDSSREALKLGLFAYPVLQAADILLYNTTHVPIGEDQVQHLEFTRSLANSFNKLYGDGSIFPLPQTIISPAKRVMSLRNPAKKMSKSDPDENSRILITDTPEVIHAKIKTAVTDSEDGISYDIVRRPGISNLVDMLYYSSQNADCSQAVEQPSEIAKQLKNLSKKAFKELVAFSVIASLDGIRERYQTVLSSPHETNDAAFSGKVRARLLAGQKMSKVYQAMGIEITEPKGQTTHG